MKDEATRGVGDATLPHGQAPVERVARTVTGGRLLGKRYRVQAMLGAGGMGSVFLAHDEELGERVAVKMLNPELVESPEMLERFRSEVRLARRVTHKNVARTYDIGEDGDARFLTMEYIDGESLAALLRRTGPLPFAQLVAIADGIAGGLAAAHEAGVVHRDLKPQNVMLARDGRVVLTDFGVAVARAEADARDLAGTPAYMAPEQLAGEAVDERADIYALGVVLFRMATGRAPAAPGADPCEHRPQLPASFGELVRRCLDVERERRFGSAADVQRALAGVPVVEDEPPPTTMDAGRASLAIVDALDITGQRLLVVAPITSPPELEPLARWLTGALALAFASSAIVRATDPSDARAEAEAEAALEARDESIVARIVLCSRRGLGRDRAFWEGEVVVAAGDAPNLPDALARAVEEVLAVEVLPARKLPPLPRTCLVSYARARTTLEASFGDAMPEALALLESALAVVPDHPLLLSTIAYATARGSFWRGETLGRAREASERAVAVAPWLAESHLARASVAWQEAEPVAVARSLRQALEIAPGHPQARYMLGQVLLEAGAPGDAIRVLEDTLARAPYLHRARIDIAQNLALRGGYARARRILDSIPETHREFGSSRVWRCRHLLWERDVDGLKVMLESLTARPDVPYGKAFREVYALALQGRPARTLVDNPVVVVDGGAVPRRRALAFQVAVEVDAYSALWDEVLDRLARAVEVGLQDVFWFDRCPVLDELRGSRRFEGLRAVVRERAAAALGAIEDG